MIRRPVFTRDKALVWATGRWPAVAVFNSAGRRVMCRFRRFAHDGEVYEAYVEDCYEPGNGLIARTIRDRYGMSNG